MQKVTVKLWKVGSFRKPFILIFNNRMLHVAQHYTWGVLGTNPHQFYSHKCVPCNSVRLIPRKVSLGLQLYQ